MFLWSICIKSEGSEFFFHFRSIPGAAQYLELQWTNYLLSNNYFRKIIYFQKNLSIFTPLACHPKQNTQDQSDQSFELCIPFQEECLKTVLSKMVPPFYCIFLQLDILCIPIFKIPMHSLTLIYQSLSYPVVN